MPGTQSVFTTSRLRLEPLAPEHLPLALALDGDPEVMLYLTGRAVEPAEAARGHERRLAAGRAVPGLGCWAGRLHREDGPGEDGDVVGWWALEPVLDAEGRVRPGQAELGYRLLRRWWRQGLGAEGARALVAHGFTDLGLDLVMAQTMAVNVASRATMAACGLRHVRTLHLHFDDPLPGTELGEVVYELGRDDWLRGAEAAARPAEQPRDQR